jgi:hypothetical protein
MMKDRDLFSGSTGHANVWVGHTYTQLSLLKLLWLQELLWSLERRWSLELLL